MKENRLEVISDNLLMLEVSKGKTDKLGLLFTRYNKILFSFFFNIYQNAEVSEDLVQNTFMRILKYRKRYNGSGDFKCWMFRIARNVSHDHYRRNRWRKNDDIENWNDKMKDHATTREGELEKMEEMEILQLAIRKLDHEKREILTLSKLEGMKYKVIADILDCTEGAVKVKVYRALNALREEYNLIQSKV